jgi:hypothetical protein
MDASRRTGSLHDTRTNIMKFITDWANDTTREQSILWIHGLAGSGKSTLSTTIANFYRDSEQLGAFLFFDRDVTERSDPARVIRTLAYQLGTYNSKFGAAIRSVVERHPNTLVSPLGHQFQKLVVDPLSTTDLPAPAIIIVLDALDECGTADERDSLLAVLVQDFNNLPSVIRTVVTSRTEIDIYNTFESRHHILTYELGITSSSNSDDILTYFRYRTALIRAKNKHLKLGTDWPGEDVLHQLVQRASGLFVWASTACEFINGHAPKKRLDHILRGETASGAEAALDALYRTSLESIDLWDDEDFVEEFRDIMGTIVVARQPLSSTIIDALLQKPEDCPSMHTISFMGCLLQQNPTVRVLHPSFADFLTTNERCGREVWFFDSHTPTSSFSMFRPNESSPGTEHVQHDARC